MSCFSLAFDTLAKRAGPGKSKEAVKLFTFIADMAEEIMEENNG